MNRFSHRNLYIRLVTQHKTRQTNNIPLIVGSLSETIDIKGLIKRYRYKENCSKFSTYFDHQFIYLLFKR